MGRGSEEMIIKFLIVVVVVYVVIRVFRPKRYYLNSHPVKIDITDAIIHEPLKARLVSNR